MKVERSRHSTLVFAGLAASALILAGCAAPHGGSSAGAEVSTAELAAAPAAAVAGSGGESLRAPSAELPRKVIFNATLDLVVKKITPAEQELRRLLRQHQGYVAETNLGSAPGEPRTGVWKVRVPADRFEAFLTAVSGIGEVHRVQSDSQDVTEEYYDLEARIRNKQAEEQRLLQHLQRSTAGLADILAVEKELSRVREEVERMQGRFRVLSNLTALTTVTVTFREAVDFTAPSSPSFAGQIRETFGTSVSVLREFGKGVILLAVAVAPWVLFAALIVVPLWLVARRARKSSPDRS